MKNIHKTFIFTLGLCILTIASALAVQVNANSIIGTSCSYIDPAVVDILAFLLSGFLIVEGVYRIQEHSSYPLKKQITRSIRIAFGFAILTLHVVQIIYKF